MRFAACFRLQYKTIRGVKLWFSLFHFFRNNRACLLDSRHRRGAQQRTWLHRRESTGDATERSKNRAGQHTSATDHRQPRPCQTGEAPLPLPCLISCFIPFLFPLYPHVLEHMKQNVKLLCSDLVCLQFKGWILISRLTHLQLCFMYLILKKVTFSAFTV